jgi:hypothetical protein
VTDESIDITTNPGTEIGVPNDGIPFAPSKSASGQTFIDNMNKHYSSALTTDVAQHGQENPGCSAPKLTSNMQRSVMVLKGNPILGPKLENMTIEWGEYQKVVMPHQSDWPGRTGWDWESSVWTARESLRGQLNDRPAFPGSADIPHTKLLLLDTLIRKCFSEHAVAHIDGHLQENQFPGVPITIDVAMKSKNDRHREWHDIEFYWIVAGKCARPVHLFLRMICAYAHDRRPGAPS